MVEIITNQRDRFRDRMDQLEADKRTLQQTLGQQQGELETLRADNLKLFEKIKFLQSYQGQKVIYSEFRSKCPFTVFHESFMYGFFVWRYEKRSRFSRQFFGSWKNGPLWNVPLFCSGVVFESIFWFFTEEMFLTNTNGQSKQNSLYRADYFSIFSLDLSHYLDCRVHEDDL